MGAAEEQTYKNAQISVDQEVQRKTSTAQILADEVDQRNASTAQILADEPSTEEKKTMKSSYLGKALTISVAYAANAGGTGTLIGTGVNPILKGQADEYVI